MQFEMAHLTCPLCKRELPANSPEQTLSTRLCPPCQKMVLMALRGANWTTAVSAVVVPLSAAPEPIQPDAPAFDSVPLGASTLSEVTPGDSFAFEYESRPPIPLEESGSGLLDFYQNEEPIERIQLVQDSHPGSENDSSQIIAPVVEESVSSIGTTDREYSEVDDSQLIAQSTATESTVEFDFGKTHLVEEQIEGPPLIRAETAADPWENPLAPWDYSRSEWPALDGATRQRSFSRKRYAIAAVVLIVSAAGFYFLALRPSDPQQATTVNGAKAQVSGVTPLAVPTAPAHSEAPAAPAPTLSENVSGETPKPADSPDQETVAGKDAEGQFSLQAAAFATQIGADEFAEKLKQAGLASYVVPADLARRGRWYRVRVGRFDSEESAQRFAAEAQRRARAAGIGVQLIVCQYGQP